jgi:enoyl-CoA hydratase/carnithine racemase
MARKPSAPKTGPGPVSPHITARRRKSALEIRFNRPEKLNALTQDMAEDIRRALVAAETDRRIHAVILHGDDRAFCAGADLGGPPVAKGERFDLYRRRFNVTPNRQLMRALCFYTKPVISAVEGYCLGGGFEIALWGDIIVAGEAARFGFPEVRHGLMPGVGGTQTLPRLIGPQAAKEIIWSGRFVEGAEAHALGIAGFLTRPGKALTKARALAASFAANGPLGIMMSKQAIDRGLDQSRFNGLLQEGDLFQMLYFSDDMREGMKAFSERRKAHFGGQ